MAVEGRREKLEGDREALDARPGTRLSTAARLSDADLLRRVVVLATAEREATVELVAHLAELDARRLYLGEGYSSLFGYCTGVLRLAEHAAYNRIEAARASREFPAILDLLADGSLNLSTVRLLAPHLQADTFAAVVDMAKGRSKREVEALVARLAPQPDVASSVRRLPAPVRPAATVAAGSRPRGSRPRRSSPPWIDLRQRQLCMIQTLLTLPSSSGDPPSGPLSPRSLQGATGCSSRSAKRRTRSCAEPRTSSAARSPTATLAQSSTARSRSCWRTLPGRSCPRRRSPDLGSLRARDHVTYRHASSGPCGCATEVGAPSWARTVGDARSVHSWSFITGTRTRSVARRRRPTSPCDVTLTTPTRRSWPSARTSCPPGGRRTSDAPLRHESRPTHLENALGADTATERPPTRPGASWTHQMERRFAPAPRCRCLPVTSVGRPRTRSARADRIRRISDACSFCMQCIVRMNAHPAPCLAPGWHPSTMRGGLSRRHEGSWEGKIQSRRASGETSRPLKPRRGLPARSLSRRQDRVAAEGRGGAWAPQLNPPPAAPRLRG
jgi:hypothetical protein